MSDNEIGTLAWYDLTVSNADQVRDFYASVVGWKVNPVDMGDYQDYSMQLPDSGADVAGVCHARGENSDMPAQWMMYFKVANLDESLQQVLARGGEMLTGEKSFGGSTRYAVIKDPAGAVCAIYQE